MNRKSPVGSAVDDARLPSGVSSSHANHLALGARVLRLLPATAVFAALAALGYFGHHTGWKLPAFAELTGSGETDMAEWCAEHGVPEEICIACNADLMPKGRLYGWCTQHGVAECVWEHPELAQSAESPAITQEDLARAAGALEIKQRTVNDPLCKLHLRRIQFVSREAADKAGIDIALVERGRVVETVTANGKIGYDPTRVTRVSSRAAGTVWRVDKRVGDKVRAGELLALVDAATVGQSKAELLQAAAQLDLQEKTLERLSTLDGVVANRRLQETEAARAAAEAATRRAILMLTNLGLPITLDGVRGKTSDALSSQIHFLGLPPDVSRQLDPRRTTANLAPVESPRDGVVVTRDLVAGEVIETAKTLFTIVDNREMWLLLDVPLEDARYAAIGQKVVFRPDGDSSDYQGWITWISPQVDAETRTVKMRAEVPNDHARLRDESFGAGRIILREEENGIVVPSDAVHWEGCCHVVFVRDRDYFREDSYKVFHTRMVRPGPSDEGTTEILAGLLPGEVIATRGSGLLRAELLKGNLGAG